MGQGNPAKGESNVYIDRDAFFQKRPHLDTNSLHLDLVTSSIHTSPFQATDDPFWIILRCWSYAIAKVERGTTPW